MVLTHIVLSRLPPTEDRDRAASLAREWLDRLTALKSSPLSARPRLAYR
jgi:hypothetical protein